MTLWTCSVTSGGDRVNKAALDHAADYIETLNKSLPPAFQTEPIQYRMLLVLVVNGCTLSEPSSSYRRLHCCCAQLVIEIGGGNKLYTTRYPLTLWQRYLLAPCKNRGCCWMAVANSLATKRKYHTVKPYEIDASEQCIRRSLSFDGDEDSWDFRKVRVF